MKRILILSAILLVSLQSFAGDNDKYLKGMKSALEMVDNAESMEDMLAAANRFERIANAEPGKWLPYYHASMCYVLISYMDEDKTKLDSYLDKADALLESARNQLKKKEKNAEIHVLQSWIHSARIAVDPMSRGMKYGPMSGSELELAIQIDPENPRAYYLQGSSAFYTPEQWGGGKDKAKVLCEKAKEKFAAFEPESEIHPNWGNKQNEEILKACNE